MPAAEKLDLVKLHKSDYATPRTPALIETSPARYLSIEGVGSPSGEAFENAVAALYAVAYTVKMASKRDGRDYTVSKLEGLWWVPGDCSRFMDVPKQDWCWRLLIRIPDFVTRRDIDAARPLASGKKPAASRVELFSLNEGLCVQVLHVGPYADEPATILLMKAFAAERKLRYHGLHHEIYLGDPRRGDPARLRTILRMPVRK